MTFEIGQSAEKKRCFSASDIAAYNFLGGNSPGGEQVPEPLIGALFSYLLGVKLPGLGTHYLKQESHYPGTARVDELLTARVEISRLRPDKQLVNLLTVCTGSDGRLICEGRALVYVGDVAR